MSSKNVATWRGDNAYTWHEEPDLTTILLISGKTNGKFGHLGGAGEINKGMTKPPGD
ncbi:HNH endonuclease [Collimonas arenae]|uniref:HNH endonuclease n=1 Tax=Collimonas arenae TaxID=279058 RepID=UPI0012E06A1B